MEFSREGQHTIKCVITEDEIMELGFSLDEIMGNGERTQEFMNQIFDLAEKKFETKFDMGIKTVRADFLPNHTLSLTFSEHPSAGGMMDHLKDIVNGLLNSIPTEKWEEIKAAKAAQDSKSDNIDKEDNADSSVNVIVLLKFLKLDTVIRFAKQVMLDNLPYNCLYKYDDAYYLLMDLSGVDENTVYQLSALTDEYASDIQPGTERWAFMEEHAEVIMKEEAIEHLRLI